MTLIAVCNGVSAYHGDASRPANVDGDIIAVFDSSRAERAEKVAERTGGFVVNLGLALNRFPSRQIPAGKKYYVVTLKKNGEVASWKAEPPLTTKGSLKPSGWHVERVRVKLRVYGWRLIVAMFADSPKEVEAAAQKIRKEILKNGRAESGEF